MFLKEDGKLYKDGDVMRRPKLADTLQTIADEGVEAFYSGSLADNIIADIKDYGKSAITMVTSDTIICRPNQAGSFSLLPISNCF